MEEFFDKHASNIAFLVCVICSAVLAYVGVSGWGWFLFIAFLIGVSDD